MTQPGDPAAPPPASAASIEEERRLFTRYFVEALRRGLAERGVPPRRQAAWLAAATQRSTVTVGHWLRGDHLPGLDDARRIFHRARFDAETMLGLDVQGAVQGVARVPREAEMLPLQELLGRDARLRRWLECGDAEFASWVLLRQDGDEMQGEIDRGCVYALDTSIRAFVASGIYALRRARRVALRRVTLRLGADQAVLACANPRYADELVACHDGQPQGLDIVGRVAGVWQPL